MHVVVIGGGISGLSAAWTLSRPHLARVPIARTVQPTITVLESSAEVGGKIRTSEFAGVAVEEGADAFLARVPWATHLCQELGLTQELTSPAQQNAFVWNRRGLQPFPKDTVLGVPSNLLSLARNKTISPRGILRATADYWLPNVVGRSNGDISIADSLGRRLGSEVLNHLIDPLLGGINAGNVNTLSLFAAAPQLAELATHKRSLLFAAREQLRRRNIEQPPQPVFYATRGGLSTLVHTLEKSLIENDVTVRTNSTVQHIERRDDAWSILVGEERITADAIVIATPAFIAANLLAGIDRTAAHALAEIRYASVGMIRLAYQPHDVPGRLDGSGFVVPANLGHLMTACSWVTSKWKDADESPHIILRASVGRMDDDRFEHFSDEELVDAIHVELTEAMGIQRRPVEWDVIRWSDSFPQYEVGHRERLRSAQHSLQTQPCIALAGSAYNGIGIPACIRSGNEAGEDILGRLAHLN